MSPTSAGAVFCSLRSVTVAGALVALDRIARIWPTRYAAAVAAEPKAEPLFFNSYSSIMATLPTKLGQEFPTVANATWWTTWGRTTHRYQRRRRRTTTRRTGRRRRTKTTRRALRRRH